MRCRLRLRTLFYLLVAVVICSSMALCCLFWLQIHNGHPLRRALPQTASEILDYHYSDVGDFTYFLTAQVSEDAALEYFRRIGLEPISARFETGPGEYFSWEFCSDPPTWWSPNSGIAKTWCLPNGTPHANTFGKFENGQIFLYAYSQ